MVTRWLGSCDLMKAAMSTIHASTASAQGRPLLGSWLFSPVLQLGSFMMSQAKMAGSSLYLTPVTCTTSPGRRFVRRRALAMHIRRADQSERARGTLLPGGAPKKRATPPKATSPERKATCRVDPVDQVLDVVLVELPDLGVGPELLLVGAMALLARVPGLRVSFGQSRSDAAGGAP